MVSTHGKEKPTKYDFACHGIDFALFRKLSKGGVLKVEPFPQKELFIER
jgi:hypothetical protein